MEAAIVVSEKLAHERVYVRSSVCVLAASRCRDKTVPISARYFLMSVLLERGPQECLVPRSIRGVQIKKNYTEMHNTEPDFREKPGGKPIAAAAAEQ